MRFNNFDELFDQRAMSEDIPIPKNCFGKP
jgi:hypothetical protein